MYNPLINTAHKGPPPLTQLSFTPFFCNFPGVVVLFFHILLKAPFYLVFVHNLFIISKLHGLYEFLGLILVV